MKLDEPEWICTNGTQVNVTEADPPPGFWIVGIIFWCPCAPCVATGKSPRLGVRFANPIGGPDVPTTDQDIAHNRGKRWTRSGETFATLSITPSIDATKDENDQPLPVDQQHWHGFVTNGVCI